MRSWLNTRKLHLIPTVVLQPSPLSSSNKSLLQLDIHFCHRHRSLAFWPKPNIVYRHVMIQSSLADIKNASQLPSSPRPLQTQAMIATKPPETIYHPSPINLQHPLCGHPELLPLACLQSLVLVVMRKEAKVGETIFWGASMGVWFVLDVSCRRARWFSHSSPVTKHIMVALPSPSSPCFFLLPLCFSFVLYCFRLRETHLQFPSKIIRKIMERRTSSP
jgi:hypothetical protein